MASLKKHFNCDNCEASGTVSIKSNELDLSDIRICPVCGSPLLEDFDEDDD